MMIDINKKYMTRDGCEVRIYATDGKPYQQIHGAISIDGKWEAAQWYDNGVYYGYGTSCFDLIEVRPRHKRTVWLNVHPDNEYAAFGERAEADEVAYERIACIKVDLDFQEGDGL